MERNIPLVGWLVIGCLVSLVIFLNFSLWIAWRRKNNHNNSSLNLFQKSGQLLRQPWQKEDEQLQKLARVAEKLHRDKSRTPEDNDQRQN